MDRKITLAFFCRPNRIPVCCRLQWLLILAASLFCSNDALSQDTSADFFEARVRPVLIKHCLQCHGADKQEGSLRLDSREGWMKGGDRGAAIVIGEPDESLLIKAIRHSDPDLEMPPSKKLTPMEIRYLEEWVAKGAYDPRVKAETDTERLSVQEAESFWSFQPIRQSAIPEVDSKDWSINPVDAFVYRKLKEQNLTPVSVADRRTLIRRATFDLTGLPPTQSEIKEFLDDQSEDAFAKLVDRLLDSPAYGERWGRHWLDVARYADTAGDGADYPVREAYKYRNWVIEAFNNDKPIDDFIREQLAGDILAQNGSPEEYADRVTATGFLAIGKRYGYKASPDYQHLDFADAIDSVGRSLMGLSLGCARCHDHKYDPISAEDYYALYGIMQSTKWAFPGGEEQKRPAHFPPLIPHTEVARLNRAKTESLAELDREITALKAERTLLDPNFIAGGIDLGFESQTAGEKLGEPWFHAGPIEVLTEAQSPFTHVHPQGKVGVRIGSGLPTDGIRYVFKDGLRSTSVDEMHFTVDFRTLASEASENKGAFRFYLGRGVVQSLAIECSATSTEFAIRNGSDWETIRKLEPGTWYTLQISIDPKSKSYAGVVGKHGDLTTFKDKKTGPNWDGVVDCFICDAFGHVDGKACARDIDHVGLQSQPFAAVGDEVAKEAKSNDEVKRRLAEMDLQLSELNKKREIVDTSSNIPVAYGVAEADPVNARVQQRGEPHRLGDEIPRRNLEVLGGELLEEDTGSGRLELANWITRSSNPLTARVFVNRVWQWHFGQGLVATPSDFGSRGEPPTHPELLDWLAAELIETEWSLKSIHRLIMNSRTYQLASSDHAANLLADPANRFHWRYSRRALDAESIRDAMLALSGKLDRTTPQAHPFPPVNTWGFTIHRPFHAIYESDHRSVYLMVQRNRRHPYLALFDAADPNQSVEKRQPTTTPTQALFLMNSPFVHEQSKGFGRQITAVAGDDLTKTLWALETAHGRIPQESVVKETLAFVSAYRERLGDQSSREEQELAAWSALARVLLTSNQFLFVD